MLNVDFHPPPFWSPTPNLLLWSELCRLVAIYGRVPLVLLLRLGCVWIWKIASPPTQNQSCVSFCRIRHLVPPEDKRCFFCAHCPKWMKEGVLAAQPFFFFFGRLRNCFLCDVSLQLGQRDLWTTLVRCMSLDVDQRDPKGWPGNT